MHTVEYQRQVRTNICSGEFLLFFLLIVFSVSLSACAVRPKICEAPPVSARTESLAGLVDPHQVNDTRTPIRMLFIGNGFTSANDLPGMVQALVNSGSKDHRLAFDMETVGGAKLSEHWEQGVSEHRIASMQWDYVVLQEQSQLALPYFCPGKKFIPYVTKFHELIKSHNAKTILFMTWLRKDTPYDPAVLFDAYFAISQKLGTLVAPVGIAIECAKSRLPGWSPYVDVGGQPTLGATYLAANVFYSLLLGESPVGLPESIHLRSGATVSFDKQEAAVLQKCAVDAVTEASHRFESKDVGSATSSIPLKESANCN